MFTSTVYTGMVVVGALRFVCNRRTVVSDNTFAPPVSLLKPLHGAEPDLHAHLATFFEQDYSGPFEILFCARKGADSGLAIARKVAAAYPGIPAQFFIVDEPVYINAKVSSLEQMGRAAMHDLFLISDSDVRVAPGYIREVVQAFADEQVGATTCLYRGTAEQGLWAKLEAAGMSVEMTGGVLAANLVEPMQFLLGPTMAVRRSAVEQIGGFGRLGPYCSDDFLLGNWIASLGYKVVLSAHVIDHIVLNLSFLTSIKHQIRWMKSTRFSRPKGHFGTGLTFCMPFGLLACVSAALLGYPAAAAGLLVYAAGSRMALAWVVAGAVVQEPALWRTVLLFPLRDLMGFFFWAMSYTSGRILWRGRWYVLGQDGLMQSASE